jgi:hypothetical protein
MIAWKVVSELAKVTKAVNWLDGAFCKIIESGKSASFIVGTEEEIREIMFIFDGAQSEEKTDLQREKFHAMIGDVQKTGVIVLPGRKIILSQYTPEKVKALLVVWFVNEKKELGQFSDIPNPPETFDCPITGESITIRPSTIKWGKKLTSEFIEFIYATGALAGVKWSEKALECYQEYRQAK